MLLFFVPHHNIFYRYNLKLISNKSSCEIEGVVMKLGIILRKLLLAVVGLAFAFAISSCNDKGDQCKEANKLCEEKQQERHHRRW